MNAKRVQKCDNNMALDELFHMRGELAAYKAKYYKAEEEAHRLASCFDYAKKVLTRDKMHYTLSILEMLRKGRAANQSLTIVRIKPRTQREA